MVLAQSLFENITYSFDTFLQAVGKETTATQGIKHSTVSVKNFFMANRIDWYCFYDKIANHVLFLDTGNPVITGSRFLDKTIQELTVSWENTSVFLTHFHVDHSGNLTYCLDRGSNGAYFIAPDAYDDSLVSQFLSWTRSSDAIRCDEQACQHLELLFGKDYFDGVNLDKCHHVGAGDAFDIAGYHLEVLPTPGHVSEHACLIDYEKGLLVAGDHLIYAKPGTMQLKPDQHLMYHYIESLKTLDSYKLSSVLMSHHDPLFYSAEIHEFIHHTWKSYEDFLPNFHERIKNLGPITVYGLASAKANQYPQGINTFAPSAQIRRIALMFGSLEALYDYGLMERRLDDDGAYVYFTKRRL